MPKFSLEERIEMSIARSKPNVFIRKDFEKFGEYDQVGRALRYVMLKGLLGSVHVSSWVANPIHHPENPYPPHERTGSLFAPKGEPAPLLEPSESALDHVAPLVFDRVEGRRFDPVGLRRNDRFDVGFLQQGPDFVGVVSLVACGRLGPSQGGRTEHLRPQGRVRALARRQDGSQQASAGVDAGVDLRAQAAARAP